MICSLLFCSVSIFGWLSKVTSTSLKEIIAPRHDDSGRKLMEVAELVDLLMPEV